MVEESERSAGGEGPDVRFEATVLAPDAGVSAFAVAERVAELDLDRIPDPEGGVRLLIDVDECVALLDRGFEVRLRRAVPVRPLDPQLIAGDDEVQAWFDERVAGTEEGQAT
ncbi:MAG TPA: hypothetical protein VM324_11535 [Egibacteraceae bacterium]|nr:hypothetical protein [Egibacteraceae bacterium]